MPDIFDELAKQAGAAVAEPPAGEKPRDVFDVLASQAQPPATSPQADPQAAQRFLLQRGNQLAQDLAEGQRQDAADAALLAGTVTPVPLDRIGPAAAPRPYQPPVMRAATPQDIAYQQSSRGQDEAAFLRYVQNLSQTNPEAAARFFDDAGNLIRRGTPTVADDLERGLRNLQLIGLNAARGVADVAGVKTPGLDQEVGRVAMIQQKNPVLVDSLNEVSTAENGPAALLSFAVRNVLEQAALMGPGMTTSQAGGLLAQQLLARKVATLAGEEAARKMGMAYAKGAAAGALAGSAGVEFGSIYGDMADQGLRGRQQALVAGIASLPTGALDAVGSYLGVRRMAGNAADPFAERIINRMFGPGSAKTRAGKLASGMTEQLTVEPATEYVQTVLEQAAVISQDPEKQSRFIQESLSAESLNNALKAAQGAFFGAGGIGAITAIPDLIRRRKPARTEGGVDSSALNPVRQVPPLADLPGKALIPVLDDNNNVVAFKIPPAGTAPTGPGAAPKIAPAGAGQPNVTGSGSSATSVGAKGQEASAEKTLDDEVMDLLTGEAGILPAKDAKGREIADATTGGVTAAVEVAGENPTQTQPSAATPGVIPGSTAPKPGSTPATPAATAGAVTPTTAPVSEGPQKAAPSTLEPGAATATAESIRNQPLAFGAKVILPDGRTGTLKAYQQDGRQAVVAIVTPDGMTSDVKNDVKVLSRDLKSATVGAASPTTAPATAPASPIVKGTERFRAVVEEGGVSVAYDPDKLSQDDVRRAIANGRVGELYDTGDAIPAEQSQGVLKAAVQRGLESSRALNEKNKAATVTEIGDDGQPVVIAKPAPLGGGVDIGAALKTGTGKPLTEEQRNAVSGQRSTRWLEETGRGIGAVDSEVKEILSHAKDFEAVTRETEAIKEQNRRSNGGKREEAKPAEAGTPTPKPRYKAQGDMFAGGAGQPKPTAAMTLPELKKEAARGGADVSALDRAGLIRAIREQRKKSQPVEPLPVEAAAPAHEVAEEPADKPTRSKQVADFGEKIGGARKDMAQKTGPREDKPKGEKSDQPGWRRRYEVREEEKRAYWSGKSERKTGKWTVFDKIKERQRGTYDTKAEAEEAIPLLEATRNHRVGGIRNRQTGETSWAIFRKVGEHKRPIVKRGFATEEEAQKYLATHPVEIIEHKFQFPTVPWLDRINREGPEVRKGDVTTRMFQETFGFRGGEFGNWNMGHEGQQALNHAYDALMDMARALGVSPKELSLHGRLGIAFGARGHGGKDSASAHYERDRQVFNLTKIRGAGSVAHEWMHALDNFLADYPNYGKSDNTGMASVGKPSAALREKVRKAFDAVVKATTVSVTTEPISAEVALKNKERMEIHIREALKDIRQNFMAYGRYKNRPEPTAEQQKAFDALAERIIAGDVGKREWVPTSEKGFNGRYSYRRVLELNEIYKKAVGSSFAKQDSHTEGRLVASIMDMERTKQRVAAAAAGETEQRTKRTQYLDDARDIDAMRAEDYWSLPEEMTARAFAAYVDDKLGPETSQYLVHAADNKYYTWPEVTKPYPEGAERTEINRKFDALFDLLRQEGSELRIKEVQAEVDKTLGKGAMKAVLMEDVPPGVRKQLADQGTDRPRAFYVEGDGLYVVVENLPQDRPLAQALRESFQHETMHGLRDVLGKERYNDLLRAVQNGLRAEDVAWVMKRYTLKTPENPKGLDALGVVDEALGKMAEDVKGVQENSRLKRIWQRACYEVRLALMKVFNKFGLTWKWLKLSENDLRVMLRKSIEGRARSEASGAWNGTAEVRAQAQAAKDPEQAKAAARRVEVDTRIFSKDLDRFEARAIEPRQILNVGRPSDVLQKLGAENLLMVMRQDVADKVLHGKQDRPGLSKEALAKLPVELDAPVMAFDSSDQRKSLVLLTSLVDAKGQPVIGAIHLSKVLGRVEVNDIASLYGKDDLRWFLEQVGEGRLRYYDRKKLIAWQRSNRLEMPNEMPTQSASGHKVLTDADVVKAEDAKAVSPSPAQEESSAAGPTVRAQAREAGPEFRVVKRGGQWIVEDRDGNEIERHATAKEARDAVWSKNIERQGAGSREQGAETEPELPPSKEEARQEVRADAVGNAGTATGSGGDMAAALAAQDRLTAAEQVAKSRADVGHIGKDWRDVYRFWRKSVTDKLKAAGGRIAAELEPAVQKFFDVKEDRAGHYGNMAERPSRELSKKENAQALAEFHDWMAMAQITPEQMTGPVQEWLKSHGLDGMTPKSIRALSSRSGQLLMDNARAVLDAMGKETEQRGLLLLDGRTGEWVRFKARENYWPHGLRPEVDEVLRDPNREFHGPGAKKRAAEWKARYENVVSQIERHIAERWSTRASVAVETLAAEPGAADILDGPKSAERDKLVARLVAKFNRPGLDTSERLADAYFASVEGRRAMDRLRANLNERPGADRTAEDIAAHRQTILDEIGEGLTRKLLALDKADLRDDVTDAISTPEMKKELAAGSPDRSKAALVAAAKRMGYKLGKTSLAKIDDVLRDGQNLTALAMPESNPEAYRGVIGVLADILEASRGTGGEDRLGARIRKALDTEATQRAMEGGDTAAASKRMAVEAQRLALQRSQKLINQALDGVDSEGNPIMRGGEEVPKGLAGLRNSLVPMDPEKAKRLAVGAIQEWTEGPLSQRRADDQNSNIERGRVGGIPPHLINYRYEEVLPSYVNRWARRVAEVEAFGQGVTKETPDLFDRIAAQADPETKQWLADYKADLFRLRRETQAEQMLRWWQSYTAVAKLGTGNVFGTIKNFTQFLNAASHLGPRAAWNELMELNKLAAEFNLAREIGVLRNDLLGGYIEMRDIADRAQRVTRAGMNTSGWTLGEETSRVLAVGFARHAKRLMLKSIAEKPASLEAARAKAFFREHGVDWQKLAAEGEEIGPETRKWLRAAEREPMFSYDDRMVSAWANKPMGRFFFQFQKYLLQMSRFTEKWVLRPAFKGYELKPEEMPSARSQLGAGLFMRGNRLHDVRPLLFFAAVIGGSEALMALRGLLYGKDRPDPPWDEIARTWDEKKARASELAMTRLLRDLLWNGGLGWLGSIAENVGNASDRVRARSPLDPPAWSTLRNIFEQIALRTWQQKRFTPDQIGDLLLNEYPGLNYGWSALKTMGVALGADYGPAHYEAARRDVSALKRASRRYADEAGFETPNRVTGERTYSEHSPELTALYEAVVTGNTAKAKQTLDALLTTGKDFDEKKRLLSSARSMIAARQPFRLGGLAPEDAREYKQDFKAWLEKRAPDLAGVLERTQATYLDTAHAVGLAGDRREMELADRVRSLTEGMGKRGLMDAALRTAATRQGLTAEQAAKALEDAKLKRLLGGGSEPLGQWRAMALDGKLDGAGISLLLRSSESRIKLAQIYSNTSLTSAQRQEAVNLLGRETFLRHLDAMTSHRPITLKEIMAAAGKN